MIRPVCQEAIDLIKKYEGLHDGDLSQIGLQPKRCPAGIWTCGYGHALRNDKGEFLRAQLDKAEAYRQYMSLTEPEAEAILARDLEIFSTGVQHLITVKLNDYQFGALVSLAYNIGLGNFANSTLRRLLNNGYFEGAAGQFERWNKMANRALKGLTARRTSERELFEKEEVHA